MSVLSLEELLQTIPGCIERLIQFDAFAIYMLRPAGTGLHVDYSLGYPTGVAEASGCRWGRASSASRCRIAAPCSSTTSTRPQLQGVRARHARVHRRAARLPHADHRRAQHPQRPSARLHREGPGDRPPVRCPRRDRARERAPVHAGGQGCPGLRDAARDQPRDLVHPRHRRVVRAACRRHAEGHRLQGVRDPAAQSRAAARRQAPRDALRRSTRRSRRLPSARASPVTRRCTARSSSAATSTRIRATSSCSTR